MSAKDVSVLILTRNEEIHLERCLRSVEPFAKTVHVVDSFSTERTQLAGGRSVTFESDLVDENLRNLSWWIAKHNGYATREAIDLLNLEHGLFDRERNALRGQARGKRWIKEGIYSRLPPGLRAL